MGWGLVGVVGATGVVRVTVGVAGRLEAVRVGVGTVPDPPDPHELIAQAIAAPAASAGIIRMSRLVLVIASRA